MKKNFMAAIAAAATVTLGGLGLYLGAPSQYLAFDINPSIELKAGQRPGRCGRSAVPRGIFYQQGQK